MNDDINPPLTAIDQIANGDQLQMIKAALPYISQSNQKYAALYIKALEISNILSFYQETQDISICSLESEQTSMLDMFHDIKNYCSETQRTALEQCIQIFQVMNTYQAMNNTSESTTDKTDLMKNFLSSEQQSLLETYQTLFSTT